MIYHGQNRVQIKAEDNITQVTEITSTKLYVPIVTLSINDNINFSKNLKQEFEITITWNKYRSEITTQPEKTFKLYDLFKV